MTRWNESRITATAILLQSSYVTIVVAAALLSPELTRGSGMSGEIGNGPTLMVSLMLAAGAVPGLVVGVLLSRLPIGYSWDRDGFSATDAGLYAAIAAVTGTFAALALLTVIQVVLVWFSTGVFAPLVVVIASAAQFGGYVLIGTVTSFFVGIGVFLCGGVLTDLVQLARAESS